jgi:hypothetical protein
MDYPLPPIDRIEGRTIVSAREEHGEFHGLRLVLDDGSSVALGSDGESFAWSWEAADADDEDAPQHLAN